MSMTIRRKDPNAVRKVYERMKSFGKKEVAVGFPAGKAQAYPDGTEVAFVAACHVYGLGVPRRDFMALAMPDIKNDTIQIMKKAALAKTEQQAEALMNAAGSAAQKDIQKAIVDLDSPPLAQSTIDAKGGKSNPLIDTSHMLQSVTYVVRDKT